MYIKSSGINVTPRFKANPNTQLFSENWRGLIANNSTYKV